MTAAEHLRNDPRSELWGEHRGRYRFAARLVRPGTRVLDVCCGPGRPGRARLVARLLDELGNAVDGPVEVRRFRLGRAGCAMQHLGQAIRVDVELEDRR
jgi:hypothetical protein